MAHMEGDHTTYGTRCGVRQRQPISWPATWVAIGAMTCELLGGADSLERRKDAWAGAGVMLEVWEGLRRSAMYQVGSGASEEGPKDGPVATPKV
jgi:hypothetical protein